MRKSNLDEMQEQELLKVEHNGCWIAFWGLLAAMAVQGLAFGGMDFKMMAGEWIVFMVLAVYLAVACARRGIWDRRFEMNMKTNLIISAAASLAFGGFTALVVLLRYQKPEGSIVAAVMTTIVTFVLCFIIMGIALKETRKRKEKLEEEPADADRI